MKSVMLSIRPKWCENIASGEKTIEVRKTKPKLETPFKCYIYCTVEMAGHDALWVLDAPTREKYSLVAVSAYLENPEGANKGNGKVIGEFTCDRIDEYDDDTIFSFRHEDYARWNDFDLDRACIHPEDFQNYANGKWLYGWHIIDLRIYDQPRELTEFRRPCTNDLYCEACAMYINNNGICNNGALQLHRPPQSWCYVEKWEEQNDA